MGLEGEQGMTSLRGVIEDQMRNDSGQYNPNNKVATYLALDVSRHGTGAEGFAIEAVLCQLLHTLVENHNS